MAFDESTDDLLDEVISRLRSTPVPEYPGPPNLDPPELQRPLHEQQQRRRGGGLLVVCAALVLCLAGLILTRSRQDGLDSQIALKTHPGLANVIAGPVTIDSGDERAEFSSLESQLDEVDGRLRAIDEEIAYQEVGSSAANLLAQYSQSKSTD